MSSASSTTCATGTSVDVVVVTWQGRHLIEACLGSLRRQTVPHRVIVVDNASTDGTIELLRDLYPEVTVVQLPSNTGFAGGVNAALEHVTSRFVALLNNDAVAEPKWLHEACGFLHANPDHAAVSCRMLLCDPVGAVNNTGIVLLATGYGADRGLGDPDGPAYDEPVEVFGASGGAAVYRTLAVKAVGGIEPAYFMYYEDADLSWRLRLAGWRIGYCPKAIVHHLHAASSDPGSASFAFYTERNRLLTLFRCAPAWFATAQTCRFVLTTASLSASRLLRRAIPDAPVFSTPLRLRVLASLARVAPGVVHVRRTSTRRRRADVLRQWRGIDAQPIAPELIR